MKLKIIIFHLIKILCGRSSSKIRVKERDSERLISKNVVQKGDIMTHREIQKNTDNQPIMKRRDSATRENCDFK